MNAHQKKGLTLFAIVFLVGVGLCQWISYLIETHVPLFDSIEVTSFFYITHIRNEGGVFGIFQGSGWYFAGFSLVFLIALCVFVLREKNLKTIEYLCAALIFSGGLSNVLDRLIYGSVIDFIDIKGIPGWHYIFNTADTLIHIGIWPWFLISFWPKRGSKPSEAVADPAS